MQIDPVLPLAVLISAVPPETVPKALDAADF